MPRVNKQKELEKVARKIWGLKKSPLYSFRIENNYMPVPGEGSSSARVMFIGEAPGKREAESGRPFVSAAGKQLELLLKSINLKRDDVFVTSIVKDRPPDNRDPSLEEIKIYTPFLIEQINIIKPKVLVALGRFALNFLLEYFKLPELGKTITALHGKPLTAKASYGKITILPLYHPATVLYNSSFKKTLQKDFLVLAKLLK